MNCGNCGAAVPPHAYACPFCQAPTQAAAEAQRMQQEALRAQQEAAAGYAAAAAQYAAADEHQQRIVARNQMNALAKQSLVWAGLGTVLCCLPLGVIGIVQGARARSLSA